MTIKDYYFSQFRLDLAAFMPDGRVSYFGHSWHTDCRGLENVIYKNRAYFLICLYFTVLVDQAMHAHFLEEGMYLFVDEVVDFCKIHIPEIDVHNFFDKLIYDPDVQIPLIVVLANPDLKHDTGYLAYEALKKAIDKKLK